MAGRKRARAALPEMIVRAGRDLKLTWNGSNGSTFTARVPVAVDVDPSVLADFIKEMDDAGFVTEWA
jgi:hypothetical protein